MNKNIREQVRRLVILSILAIHAVNGSARVKSRRSLRRRQKAQATAALGREEAVVFDAQLFVGLMDRAIGWTNRRVSQLRIQVCPSRVPIMALPS
jgi:hypothetical protein